MKKQIKIKLWEIGKLVSMSHIYLEINDELLINLADLNSTPQDNVFLLKELSSEERDEDMEILKPAIL